MHAEESCRVLRAAHPALFEDIAGPRIFPQTTGKRALRAQIGRRLELIHSHITDTISENPEAVEAAVHQFGRWMDDRAIVRVLGAGRARLAAAIPANRLAHGGARVFLQDALVPMPHSLHGGGIIAASASGKTPSVIQAAAQAKQKNKDICVVGIAARDAVAFASVCDIFIGIPHAVSVPGDQLSALADIGEYTISELLDALVVAAGQELGYTDATWRLGHEDLGPATGPYDHLLEP